MKTEKELAREIYTLLQETIADHSEMCKIWGDNFSPDFGCWLVEENPFPDFPVFVVSDGRLVFTRGGFSNSLQAWMKDIQDCLQRLAALREDLEKGRPVVTLVRTMIETTVKITRRLVDILHFLTDEYSQNEIRLPKLLFQSDVMRCDVHEPFCLTRRIDIINLNLQELISQPAQQIASASIPASPSKPNGKGPGRPKDPMAVDRRELLKKTINNSADLTLVSQNEKKIRTFFAHCEKANPPIVIPGDRRASTEWLSLLEPKRKEDYKNVLAVLRKDLTRL